MNGLKRKEEVNELDGKNWNKRNGSNEMNAVKWKEEVNDNEQDGSAETMGRK